MISVADPAAPREQQAVEAAVVDVALHGGHLLMADAKRGLVVARPDALDRPVSTTALTCAPRRVAASAKRAWVGCKEQVWAFGLEDPSTPVEQGRAHVAIRVGGSRRDNYIGRVLGLRAVGQRAFVGAGMRGGMIYEVSPSGDLTVAWREPKTRGGGRDFFPHRGYYLLTGIGIQVLQPTR